MTDVPGGPLDRLIDKVGVTLKVKAEELTAVDVIATEWLPPAAVGTLKEVAQEPWELAEMPEATAVPSKVMVMLSLAAKPKPLTNTGVPEGPLNLPVDMLGVTTKGESAPAVEVVPEA